MDETECNAYTAPPEGNSQVGKVACSWTPS